MKTGSKAKNGKKAGMSKRERRFFWIGLLFLSPWLIGFLAFSVYPICAAVYYSFTDYSIFTAPKWIGVKNYLDIFADKMIWKSLLNTAYITVVGLPVSIIISLALALLLNQKVKGLPIFRTLFYLPTVVPVVASAMLFMWVLNPEYGILNMALGAFGIRGPAWLSDPRFTKLSLILMDVWRCGGTMIIFLSALQSVPPTFYEAADLDGASAWKKFWRITVPYISPTIQFTTIMGLISSFQYFTQAFVFGSVSQSNVLTPGGPQNSLMFYSLYLYQQGFTYLKMGYASAMALVLFVVVMAVSFVALRVMEKHVNYDVE